MEQKKMGRPKGKETAVISAKIDIDTVKKLREFAEKNGMIIARIIETALNEYIERKK